MTIVGPLKPPSIVLDAQRAPRAVLKAQDLYKHFGGLAAISGVTMEVRQGEILGLIGPNGAGKTTLFNLLSGAISPDKGKILFNGTDITRAKPHRIAKMGIARTFQSVKVFSRLSVHDNVRLASIFGHQERRANSRAAKDASELIDFVRLADFEKGRAAELTLVNQKRLEVARALATNPTLLLLDEVMAGLTPTEVSDAMELVKRIRARGVTVVMIEHVMKAIMNICDRIVVLHHGEKIAEGDPEEIVNNPTVIEIYLGE